MNSDQVKRAQRLGARLQGVASALGEVLSEAAEEEVGFVLVMHACGTAQYVSNVEREGGVKMLSELFARWEAKRPDVPAQVNPDLAKTPALAVTIYPDRAEHYCNVLDHAIGRLDAQPGEKFTVGQLRELRRALGD